MMTDIDDDDIDVDDNASYLSSNDDADIHSHQWFGQSFPSRLCRLIILWRKHR